MLSPAQISDLLARTDIRALATQFGARIGTAAERLARNQRLLPSAAERFAWHLRLLPSAAERLA